MAKKNVQPAESDVEIITPDANKKQLKKNEKVDNKQKKAAKKNKSDKKSLKKKAGEVWSELKKVSRPSFGTVCKNTCVVISVVAICTLLLFGVDRLFSLINNLLLP